MALHLLSVVIPIKNERENVEALHQHVTESLAEVPAWELILVDDGSTDQSFEIMSQIAANDPRTKVIRLRRNYGQAAAMQAGIDAAVGDLVATMDGDLQNDASDLPLMMAKLEEGYDVVLGERVRRQDGFVLRKLPSRLANAIIRKVTGLPFRDFGCATRVMRSEIARDLKIYGEMHRFIPVLANQLGARITQLPVKHHARRAGTSKYGLGRTGRVVLDLLTVKFISGYLTRPMHFMGGVGLSIFSLGVLSLMATVAMKVVSGIDMTGNPLLLLSALLALVGMQFLSVGLLGEVLMRTYFESQGKAPYSIRETRNYEPNGKHDRRAA
jgi:glycosyltransferase involved in cell wall biosynthesis